MVEGSFSPTASSNAINPARNSIASPNHDWRTGEETPALTSLRRIRGSTTVQSNREFIRDTLIKYNAKA